MSFGPSISLWAIELGVISTLETYLEQSLSLQDRTFFTSEQSSWAILPRPVEPAPQLLDSSGVAPDDPTSIHGGIDTITTDFDLMPEIVVSIQPDGDPVYFGSGDYTAEYVLTINALIYDESETRARAFAGMYGAAIDQTILQNGSLGGIATRTRLIQQAKLEFVDTEDEDDAYLIQSVSTFTIYVDAVVNDRAGIATPVAGDTLADPDSSQTPPAAPLADTVEVQVAVVADDADLADANFTDGLEPSDTLFPGDDVYPESGDLAAIGQLTDA